MRAGLTTILLATASVSPAFAAGQPPVIDEVARAFGARPAVDSVSLSPEGTKIALVAAGEGRTSRVFVLDVQPDAKPVPILTATGQPEYIYGCAWVAATRLACNIGGQTRYNDQMYSFNNIVALDSAGGNVKLLSERRNANAQGYDFRGGAILDLLPAEDGAILMSRSYVPESKAGSLVESRLDGLGVDRVDTRTVAIKHVEKPLPLATHYISDGLGNIRIMGQLADRLSYQGRYRFQFRAPGSSDWQALSIYDSVRDEGFYPVGVDPQKNVAYGFEKVDGRDALVSIKLDGSRTREVVFAHPKVDVSGVVRVGRNRRIVGVGYTLEHDEAVYFDTATNALVRSLGKALGGKSVYIGDMSQDEKRVLVWAGSDLDPGQYYLFDRTSKQLTPIMPDRPQLTGRTLATMKPISYPAADGTSIPAYLTLPPGKESAKGLPAIVMPHGGPESRDQWGFDWLSQYFAARGFAVIQPEFRGSYGFGKQWLMGNGFRSWRTSIGDVADAGRWLVAQGIADPAKLTIFGWSYGGYAALQVQALDPALFKAVVAVAPVTDIDDMLAHADNDGTYEVTKTELGHGREAEEASPTSYAAAFKSPVLMFHGTLDANVDISQSKLMQSRLQAAGKRSELVVYEGLTHSLVDSNVRAELLQRSADFLLAAGK